MVQHHSGAHALDLIEPVTLESVMSMPLAVGHEIDALASFLLPTKEQIIGNDEAHQANFGHSLPAHHTSFDSPSLRSSPCFAQKPHEVEIASASSESGAASAGTSSKLVDGTVVATQYDREGLNYFVCREHLLQTSSFYHVQPNNNPNQKDGPVGVVHLLTVYKPRLERIPRHAKVRYGELVAVGVSGVCTHAAHTQAYRCFFARPEQQKHIFGNQSCWVDLSYHITHMHSLHVDCSWSKPKYGCMWIGHV
jgi:hypothetical protein